MCPYAPPQVQIRFTAKRTYDSMRPQWVERWWRGEDTIDINRNVLHFWPWGI